jgi:hypothetical protein
MDLKSMVISCTHKSFVSSCFHKIYIFDFRSILLLASHVGSILYLTSSTYVIFSVSSEIDDSDFIKAWMY